MSFIITYETRRVVVANSLGISVRLEYWVGLNNLVFKRADSFVRLQHQQWAIYIQTASEAQETAIHMTLGSLAVSGGASQLVTRSNRHTVNSSQSTSHHQLTVTSCGSVRFMIIDRATQRSRDRLVDTQGYSYGVHRRKDDTVLT